jgi:hypothetical protein
MSIPDHKNLTPSHPRPTSPNWEHTGFERRSVKCFGQPSRIDVLLKICGIFNDEMRHPRPQ